MISAAAKADVKRNVETWKFEIKYKSGVYFLLHFGYFILRDIVG